MAKESAWSRSLPPAQPVEAGAELEAAEAVARVGVSGAEVAAA